MATATHTHIHPQVDRSVAAVIALLLMVAAIAAIFPHGETDRLVPQPHYLEIVTESAPTGLSFQAP